MPEVETSTVTTEALDPLQLPRLAVSPVQLSASVVLVPSLLWVVVPPDTALALADTTVVLP